jgi:hypothetical protein
MEVTQYSQLLLQQVVVEGELVVHLGFLEVLAVVLEINLLLYLVLEILLQLLHLKVTTVAQILQIEVVAVVEAQAQ